MPTPCEVSDGPIGHLDSVPIPKGQPDRDRGSSSILDGDSRINPSVNASDGNDETCQGFACPHSRDADTGKVKADHTSENTIRAHHCGSCPGRRSIAVGQQCERPSGLNGEVHRVCLTQGG